MTNFEAIKGMNIREMTAFLYTFLLPWSKAYSRDQKDKMWKELEKFLQSEVIKYEK